MRERYDRLHRQAQEAFATGDLRGSMELFQAAEELAREHGEQDLADRAFCNYSAFALELGEGSEQIPRLKQILLQSTDDVNRCLAAYNTAMAYHLDSNLDRASSYARRAMELGKGLGEDYTSGPANLAGNIALEQSDFSEAETCYGEALSSLEGGDASVRLPKAQMRNSCNLWIGAASANSYC